GTLDARGRIGNARDVLGEAGSDLPSATTPGAPGTIHVFGAFDDDPDPDAIFPGRAGVRWYILRFVP
ncbi:MAG: hypothetical protein KDA28_17595, partial [Phycisphaerales bacterium]|nr:hypothetical protein [Phycisphaerales bacterium]